MSLIFVKKSFNSNERIIPEMREQLESLFWPWWPSYLPKGRFWKFWVYHNFCSTDRDLSTLKVSNFFHEPFSKSAGKRVPLNFMIVYFFKIKKVKMFVFHLIITSSDDILKACSYTVIYHRNEWVVPDIYIKSLQRKIFWNILLNSILFLWDMILETNQSREMVANAIILSIILSVFC